MEDTCKVVDESIGTSGVLVLCRGICVLKWMNGIKAQTPLGGGGCLCDILPDQITLTPLMEWQIWKILMHKRGRNAMEMCTYIQTHRFYVYLLSKVVTVKINVYQNNLWSKETV